MKHEHLPDQIRNGNLKCFYTSFPWQQIRKHVLRIDKFECQICKTHGRYSPAEIVHHVNHVRDYPELCLSLTYTDAAGTEQRNLISVCKPCHDNVCHPNFNTRKPPLSPERW